MDEDKEIVISREINASPARLWEALTNPQQLVEWWGPEGFTNTFESIDIREGGEWKFVMHGPDGTDYHDLIKYEEIVPLEKIVYGHSGLEQQDLEEFKTIITLEEKEPGKTLLTLRSVFASPEEKEKQVKFGATEGGNSTLKKLDEFVQSP